MTYYRYFDINAILKKKSIPEKIKILIHFFFAFIISYAYIVNSFKQRKLGNKEWLQLLRIVSEHITTFVRR